MSAPLFAMTNAKRNPNGVPAADKAVGTAGESLITETPLLPSDLGPTSLTEYLATLVVQFSVVNAPITMRVRSGSLVGPVVLSLTSSALATPVKATATIAKPATTTQLFITAQSTVANSLVTFAYFSLQQA